jgi:asparagine synthase (glutamine-hydrolysing)
MCGIFGIIGAPDPAELAAMGRLLRHRGPDDEGYLLLGRHACPASGPETVTEFSHFPRISNLERSDAWTIGLGHRRLAVIDLTSTGHQPMSYANGRYWIVYNGEIYNYRDLRRELIALGFEFVGASDTEVLLASFAAWGTEAFARLDGMFAFALHDLEGQRTYLVRDRYGIKPLFHRRENGRLLFASEIKALGGGRRLRVNEAALFHFLCASRLPEAPETFYEEVALLEPGHFLEISAAGCRLARWYQPPASPDRLAAPDVDFRQDAREFADLFQEAVRSHLVSDVPVGFCLSGGLDSSSIVFQTAAIRGGALPGSTFSAVFPGEAVDERAWIDRVTAATTPTPHFTTPTAAEAIADLPALCRQQEEPLINWSLYLQWRVMRLARESGVTVLLDGQGSDELMAGYGGGLKSYLAQIRREEGEAAYRRELDLFRRQIDDPLLALEDPLAPANAAAAGFPMLHDDFFRRWTGTGRRSVEHDPSLNRMLHRLALVTSLPRLLLWEDRNSMAFSIEARVPFLAPSLVEFLLTRPGNFKLRDGWTKWPIRTGMAGIVPEAIRHRRCKFGFSAPEETWLPRQKEALLAIIDERADAGREWIDVDSVRRAAPTVEAQPDLRRLFRVASALVFLSQN